MPDFCFIELFNVCSVDIVYYIEENFTFREKEKTNDKDEKRKPESCLLLPATPKRGGDKPKAHKKTNIHILVEFGLQVLEHTCICAYKLLCMHTYIQKQVNRNRQCVILHPIIGNCEI